MIEALRRRFSVDSRERAKLVEMPGDDMDGYATNGRANDYGTN